MNEKANYKIAVFFEKRENQKMIRFMRKDKDRFYDHSKQRFDAIHKAIDSISEARGGYRFEIRDSKAKQSRVYAISFHVNDNCDLDAAFNRYEDVLFI